MSELSRLRQRVETLRSTGNPVPASIDLRIRELAPRPKKPEKPKPKKTRGGKRRFYKTREWIELRYETLRQQGAKCAACAATPADGATMNVDHIIPISRAWKRRLDPSNLQILCARCNHGKGAHDQTDWRSQIADHEKMG